MSGFRRRLSDAVTFLLVAVVSAAMLFASVMFFLPMTVLSPLLLAVTLCIVAVNLLRYPFRRRLEFSPPAPLVLVGWALALPVGAVLQPLLDLAVREAPRYFPGHGLGDSLRNAVYVGGVGVVTLLTTIFTFARLWGGTRSGTKFAGDLEGKGLALGLLGFSLQFLGLVLWLATPLTCALALADIVGTGRPGAAAGARVVLWIGAVPAVLLGLALLRRGFWTLEIRRLVEDHPRSTVRAAALGLVELHGSAVPLEGARTDVALLLTEPGEPPICRVNDFALDDGTGRVVVRLPQGTKPGIDGVVDLERNSQTTGMQQKFMLLPGDPVYVLGELVATSQGREVRPWNPPFGRFLAGVTRDFFGQDWTFAAGIDFGRAFGLTLHPEVFAVTDAGEKRLQQLTRRRWLGSLVLGLFFIGAAVAFLLRLPAR